MALRKKIFQSAINSEIGLTPNTVLKSKLLDYFRCNDIETMLRKKLDGKITDENLKYVVPIATEAANAGNVFLQNIMEECVEKKLLRN